MKIIGLTGNIGSGKSLVAQIFRVAGIPVYHADAESRFLLNQPDIIAEITGLFGETILSPERKIDRSALAKIVFTNPSALQHLNELLHPKVMEHFYQWIKFQQAAYVVHEAAILYESGFSSGFDKIICVSCPVETAMERVIRRDGVTAEEVYARMKHQIPDKIKSAMADFIIVNDGLHLLIPQVLAIHKKLSEISAQSHD